MVCIGTGVDVDFRNGDVFVSILDEMEGKIGQKRVVGVKYTV